MKLRLAKLFGRYSLCHAAAASHVFQRSYTNANRADDTSQTPPAAQLLHIPAQFCCTVGSGVNPDEDINQTTRRWMIR